MTLHRGIDQPVRDKLADLQFPAMAGICLVCDPRGLPDPVTNKRYGYLLEPSSLTAFTLFAIDLDTRAKMFLAAPPAAAGNGAYNTAIMAAMYDATGGAALDTPTIYVLVSLTAAPFSQWLAYDIRTGLWAAPLAFPTTGPAGVTPLGTSISLCHPCSTLGVFLDLNINIADRYIYANGDAGQWGAAGPSRIARYDKVGNVWAYLIGAGAARVAAPAAGAKSVWLPSNPGAIITTRGGNSAVWDVYMFATDSWNAPMTPVPVVNLAEGTELTTHYESPDLILVRPAGHVKEVFYACATEIRLGDAVYRQLCQINDSMLPAAHASNALISWDDSGNFYVGAVPYGRSIVARIQVPTPKW